eukprot:1282064-Amphidinium_carterae.1
MKRRSPAQSTNATKDPHRLTKADVETGSPANRADRSRSGAPPRETASRGVAPADSNPPGAANLTQRKTYLDGPIPARTPLMEGPKRIAPKPPWVQQEQAHGA